MHSNSEIRSNFFPFQATNAIKELSAASEALTAQSDTLREQQKERRALLDKLTASQPNHEGQSTLQMVSKRVAVPKSILDRVAKPALAGPSSSSAPVAPAASQQKESVIVLDDD